MKRLAALLLVLQAAALPVGAARAQTVSFSSEVPALLLLVLKSLAYQAGYDLQVPLAPPFLRKVRASVSGEFEEAVEGLLTEHAPGYRLEGEAPSYRIAKALEEAPAPKEPEKGGAEEVRVGGEKSEPPESSPRPQAASEPGRYLVLGADGSVVEGPIPTLQVAMVVDGVLRVKDGVVDVVLSPLGPACLYKGGDRVCLRGLLPGLEGELPVRLGGEVYTVRYRVKEDAVVLYRYSLDGAPPSGEPKVVPKPLVPAGAKVEEKASPPRASSPEKKPAPKPVAELPAGSAWARGNEVAWRGLTLKRTRLEGRWLSVGFFRAPENAARLFARLESLGLAPALYARSGGVQVLVPDGEASKAVLKRSGIGYVAFRP